VKRRDFIALIGSAAAAWPLAARAQQGELKRRIGVLNPIAADDRESPLRVAAFQQGLQQLGWAVGRNVRIDYRWGANNLDPDRMRKDAAELLALAPDVVMATAAPIVSALQQARSASSSMRFVTRPCLQISQMTGSFRLPSPIPWLSPLTQAKPARHFLRGV